MNPELRKRLEDVVWDSLPRDRIPAYEFPGGKCVVVKITRGRKYRIVSKVETIHKNPSEPWVEPPWSCSMTFDAASEVISAAILDDTTYPHVIVGYGFKEATPGEVCIVLTMTENPSRKGENQGVPPHWFLRHEREKNPTVWEHLGNVINDDPN